MENIQNFSSAWGLFGTSGVGAMMGSLAIWLAAWAKQCSAEPRLEEARRVVAEIDRRMASIRVHTVHIMNENVYSRTFPGFQQQQEK